MLPKTLIRQHTYTPLYKGVICCFLVMGEFFETLLNPFTFDSKNTYTYYLQIVSVCGLNLISHKRSYHQNLTVLEIDEASNEYRCFLHRYSYWLFLCRYCSSENSISVTTAFDLPDHSLPNSITV